ncbi:hypothetical protein [Serratia bockelmannii]|uniref:hypothetical protein n=1 Tax=Serratia bockelmannii TaxID=2703793 RepID=UPI003FA78806
MTLTTETIKQWRSDAENIARRSCAYETEYSAAEAILALTAEILANREAQPVFFIEIEGDDWVSAGRIEGENRPDLGLLPDGINYLYTAPPAPAMVGELLEAMEEVIRISDRDHDAWNRVKVAITACRGAILPAPHEPDPIDVFVAQVCGDLSAGHQR